MSLYIASYDVSDDKQRRRITKVLMDYGIRMQKSVFEVDLEPSEVRELQTRIGRLLSKQDVFDLVPIDQDPQRCRLRWQANGAATDSVIIVD